MELLLYALRLLFLMLQTIFAVLMFVDYKNGDIFKAHKHYAISNLFFTLTMVVYIIWVHLCS